MTRADALSRYGYSSGFILLEANHFFRETGEALVIAAYSKCLTIEKNRPTDYRQ
ncbi:MAG: hypothetical protein ACXVNF_15940 [Neobacillus sp.]